MYQAKIRKLKLHTKTSNLIIANNISITKLLNICLSVKHLYILWSKAMHQCYIKLLQEYVLITAYQNGLFYIILRPASIVWILMLKTTQVWNSRSWRLLILNYFKNVNKFFNLSLPFYNSVVFQNFICVNLDEINGKSPGNIS